MLKSLNSSTLLTTSNLHHAYLLIGDREEAEKVLHELFEREGFRLAGSPDFFVFKEALFGIDSARELSVMAARKAFVEKKVFLIAPEKITLEAQNALLKTFEDPVPHTHFFLSVRDEGVIIPTLRSRMQSARLVSAASEDSEAEKFLKLNLKGRLAFAKKFADAEKNLSAFLDDLLLLLREKGNPDRQAQENIYKMRLVSDQRGAAPRLVLEHLAVVI